MKMILSRTAFLLGSVLFFVAGVSGAPTAATPRTFSGATPLEWSQRLADSEMPRPEASAPKWDYAMGLFTLSLLKLNEQIPDTNFVKFAGDKIGSLISADGNIQGYKLEEYQLDALNPGKTAAGALATRHQRSSDQPRLFYACAGLVKQLETQPRTPDGGFWHKQRYTNQMWLDGIYMAEPFYAAMGRFMMQPQNALRRSGETNPSD